MSTDTYEDTTTETRNAVLDDDQLYEEGSVETQWREALEDRRISMDDAEETCVFLVEDLLAAIFEEMQVRLETASLFSRSAQQMCLQAFEAVDMSAFQAAESLDRISGLTQHEQSTRQQVLKPQRKWGHSSLSRTRASASTPWLVQSPPPLLFLRHLLKFLTCDDRVDFELLRFPTSEAISSLTGKRKLLRSATGAKGDSDGDWCIPVESITAFLLQILSKGLVSTVPSAITFVMAINHELLEKNSHTAARVALPHLQHFVYKAVLSAEDEMAKILTESTPRPRTFQTEIPCMKPHIGPQEEVLSCYEAEMPPLSIEMDRRAPGQAGKKAALSAANASQRAISRRIILLLTPPPRQGSNWTTVRHNVVLPSAVKSTTITAEADMDIHLPVDSYSSARKFTELSIQTGTGTLENDATPDTAALSNIFSLGTPRQLSAHELARRTDLLAQVEREAARAQRRATTTVISSLSLDVSTDRRVTDGALCTDEQQFQAYVAANSIVTTGIAFDGRSGSLSPTRPQQSDEKGSALRSRRRANIQRSRFELEQAALPFTVSNGSVHVEQERLAAMCSPIKRPQAPGSPIQTASTLAYLPQLEVRSVDKRGPRKNPNCKQNYSITLAEHEVDSGQIPLRLPLIPVVSPIKASLHRKHVAFKLQTDKERVSASNLSKSHVSPKPSTKTKQPVWGLKTRPPRARNYHFGGKNVRKIHHYDYESDEESSSTRRQEQELQSINAPRRNILNTTSKLDD